MKKLLLTILTASFMLAAPSIHAMAGYSFHHDLPKTISVLLDKYVSSMLPERMRLSQEYLDEVFKMKQAIKMNTFIIAKKEALSAQLANTESVGFPGYNYAILRFDEAKMAQEGPAWNSTVPAHELYHARNNHSGEERAWHRISGTLLPFMIVFGPVGLMALKKYHYVPLLLASSAAAHEYADYKIRIFVPKTKEELLARQRQHELEAVAGSYEALADCGYCMALKNQVALYQRLRMKYPEDHRPIGDIYPTLGTHLSLTENALKKCRRDIDPSTTQDSPHFMRNSPALKPALKNDSPMGWQEWLSSLILGRKP